MYVRRWRARGDDELNGGMTANDLRSRRVLHGRRKAFHGPSRYRSGYMRHLEAEEASDLGNTRGVVADA